MDHSNRVLWLVRVLYLVVDAGAGSKQWCEDGTGGSIFRLVYGYGELEHFLLFSRHVDRRYQPWPGRERTQAIEVPNHMDDHICNRILHRRFPNPRISRSKAQPDARVRDPPITHPDEPKHGRSFPLLVVDFWGIHTPIHLTTSATQNRLRDQFLSISWEDLLFALPGA